MVFANGQCAGQRRSNTVALVQRRNEQDKRLELFGGGSIEFWSLDNPDVARGRRYGLIVVDEAAMVPNLLYVWDAVLRPTLVDLTGGAWFFSTPKGRNGFWQLWQRGQDAGEPEWRSWRGPTSENPHIPASEVEAMRRSMPERIFRQEIEAEFLDDAGGVFRRVMDAAVLTPRAPVAGRSRLRVDWQSIPTLRLSRYWTLPVAMVSGRNQMTTRYGQPLKALRALARRPS